MSFPYELARLRGHLREAQASSGQDRSRAGPRRCPSRFPSSARPAQAEWRRAAPELHRLGLLTVLDRSVIAVYCASYGLWATAERLLETEGLTAKGSTGNMVPHPLLKIATQAARDVCKFGAEFGMTPCARAKMRAGWHPDGGGGPGKFDGLLA